ncbi:MAG: hypothetical protein HW380_1257 [Magnetococcales bacterium]|nr:hypothetical protein [Magnetococcales bacterium]HIJ83810.1 hypothetical protein [Magnetococcales bacterium]
MTSEKPPQAATKTENTAEGESKHRGRRIFLGGMGVTACALLAPSLGETVPIERKLQEADFYRPHDLAG